MGRWEAARLVWLLMVVVSAVRSGAQQHFDLVHGYSHLEGSSLRRGETGITPEYKQTLLEHDQRRLARMLPEVVSFPISGDDNVFITGLYYTRISLGTPPQEFYVHVDTGSDVVWVNCVPCTNCRRASNVALQISIFDPQKSSTSKDLSCTATECRIASDSSTPMCSADSQCSYSTLYGDGSSTNGYFVSDVFTFSQVSTSNMSSTSDTATLYFGCGSNQTGTWSTDGLIGFGQAAISLPSQLNAQGKTANVFAHCLQGDDKGSGSLVIGNIREPNLAYTPIVQDQKHYNVELLNIAVNDLNVTSPSSFDLTNSGGVIIDSGTTLAYLVSPAFAQFEQEVINAAPVQSRNIPDSAGNPQTCWIYSGRHLFHIPEVDLVPDLSYLLRIEGTFPNVTLYFADGAAMTLGPKNYLYEETLTSGSTAYCLGWIESTSRAGQLSYTIFGDIVLKDKLVVYDNDNQRIGWKDFDCTKGISVSSTATSTPVTVLPSQAGPPGAFGNSPSSSDSAISRLASVPSWLYWSWIASGIWHWFL